MNVDNTHSKIAYLIQAHADPEHLKRLVDSLNFKSDFFIHIDKKTKLDIYNKLFEGYDNVFLLNEHERVKVYWAGFSQVAATLALVRKCLVAGKSNHYQYKKAILLSGACYPVKSNVYIHQFFDQNKEINFIEGMNVTAVNHHKYNYCLEHYHFFDMFFISKKITKIYRKFLYYLWYFRKKKNHICINNNSISIYHGSSWWALNMDFLAYVNQFANNDSFFRKYFKHAMASDEKYFHTLFFNSEFKNTNISAGESAFVPSTAAFANLHIIDSSLSKWFTVADKEEIKNSDKLFVRKVSTSTSKSLLDWIDRELLNI